MHQNPQVRIKFPKYRQAHAQRGRARGTRTHLPDTCDNSLSPVILSLAGTTIIYAMLKWWTKKSPISMRRGLSSFGIW